VYRTNIRIRFVLFHLSADEFGITFRTDDRFDRKVITKNVHVPYGTKYYITVRHLPDTENTTAGGTLNDDKIA